MLENILFSCAEATRDLYIASAADRNQNQLTKKIKTWSANSSTHNHTCMICILQSLTLQQKSTLQRGEQDYSVLPYELKRHEILTSSKKQKEID